ncbi:MAG: PorT family protein [Bacteroidales bacterium]|nr:PorT family protein [Bacteroidales bacterium]
MNRNFLMGIIVLLSFNTYAQKKWYSSFVLGPNLTKHRNIDIYPNAISNVSSTYGLGLTAGFDFYRIYHNNVFFKTGLRYKLKSSSGTMRYHFFPDSTTYENYTLKDSYINLPVMFGYLFHIKKQKLKLSTGFEFDYMFYVNNTWGDDHVAQNVSSIYNISPKFVISASYLYRLNDKITLTVSPEFAQSKMIDEYTDFGDYLIEWHLNFGVIFKLP